MTYPASQKDGRQRVLIIKPGYSETLDPDTTGIVSLGDILRSTPILHLFPRDLYHVSWLVDEIGWPVLRGNTMIDRVLKVNAFTPFHLMAETFDVVINLEKDPGICAMADGIRAWRRYGFRFDARTAEVAAYECSHQALQLALDPQAKRDAGRSWQSVLFEMLGETYRGENHVLGHVPTGPVLHDFGLNYRAGTKYPLKVWPRDHWNALHDSLSQRGHSVAWQPAQDNLDAFESYIDWIGSCRVLVSNDSLGLHIALALGIPAVAVFGPTLATDVGDHEGLTKIWAEHAQDCPP